MPYDFSAIKTSLGHLSTEISNIEIAFSKLSKTTRNAFNDPISKVSKLTDSLKISGNEINDVSDLLRELASVGGAAFDANAVAEMIDHVAEYSNSIKDASDILEKMGIKGAYVFERISNKQKDLHKSTSNLSASFQKLSSAFLFASATGIIYALTQNKLLAGMADYQKEIYNATRVGQIFGQTHKQMQQTLKSMGDAVGLNEKTAAKFYMTWMSVSNGFVPSTNRMTALVKTLGDEFGNTKEDIAGAMQQLGKLQSMQIGIDLNFIEDLKAGLVDTGTLVNKISQLRLLNVDNETINTLLRLQNSLGVGKETKQMKTMSDLIAHLTDVAEKFIAKNGEKIAKLFQIAAVFAEKLLDAITAIPAPLVVAFLVLVSMEKTINSIGFSMKEVFSIKNLAAFRKTYDAFRLQGATRLAVPNIAPGVRGGAHRLLARAAPSTVGGAALGGMGGHFQALIGVLTKVSSGLISFLVPLTAAVAGFMFASKIIKKFNGELSAAEGGMRGASAQLFAASAASLEAQRKGARGSGLHLAETQRLIASKKRETSVSIMTAGLGAGLAAALLIAVPALFIFGPLIAGLAAGAAILAGAIAGFVGIVNVSAEIEKRNNMVNVAATEIEIREKELGRKLRAGEVKAIQDSIGSKLEEIRAAKFGAGTMGKIFEWFEGAFPGAMDSFMSVIDFTGRTFMAMLAPISWVTEGIVLLADKIGWLVGGGGSREESDEKAKGPYSAETSRMKDIAVLKSQAREVADDMDIIEKALSDAYIKGDKKVSIALLAEKKKLENKKLKLAKETMTKELLNTPKYLKMRDKTKAGQEARAEAQAMVLVDLEKKRADTAGQLSRNLDAITKGYETQLALVQKIQDLHEATYNLMKRGTNSDETRKELEQTIKLQKDKVALAKNALKQIDSAYKEFEGGQGAEDEKSKATASKTKISKQIVQIEGKKDFNEGDKAIIEQLKEKMAIYDQILSGETASNAVTNARVVLETKLTGEVGKLLDLQLQIGDEHDRQVQVTQSQVNLGQTQLDLANSFMGGIAVSYDMLANQVDRVRKLQDDILLKEEDLVDQKQKALELEKLSNSELEKAKNKLAEAQADPEVSKNAEQMKKIQDEINQKTKDQVEASARVAQQEVKLNEVAAQRLGAVKQELELTKELRYGYLNAMTSQAMAAGKFDKILFKRDQNFSKMMSITTKEMERQRKEAEARGESTVGMGGYVATIGGQLQSPEALEASKNIAKKGFAQYTPGGFETRGIADTLGVLRGTNQANVEDPEAQRRRMGEKVPKGKLKPQATDIQQTYGGINSSAAKQGVVMDQAVRGIPKKIDNLEEEMRKKKSEELLRDEVKMRPGKTEAIQSQNPPLSSTSLQGDITGKQFEQINIELGMTSAMKPVVSQLKIISLILAKNAGLEVGVGPLAGAATGGAINLKDGFISGGDYRTSVDNVVANTKGKSHYIVRKSESKDPAKRKIIKDIQSGAFDKNSIKAQRDEGVIEGKHFKNNPEVLNMLENLNNPNISAFQSGGLATQYAGWGKDAVKAAKNVPTAPNAIKLVKVGTTAAKAVEVAKTAEIAKETATAIKVARKASALKGLKSLASVPGALAEVGGVAGWESLQMNLNPEKYKELKTNKETNRAEGPGWNPLDLLAYGGKRVAEGFTGNVKEKQAEEDTGINMSYFGNINTSAPNRSEMEYARSVRQAKIIKDQNKKIEINKKAAKKKSDRDKKAAFDAKNREFNVKLALLKNYDYGPLPGSSTASAPLTGGYNLESSKSYVGKNSPVSYSNLDSSSYVGKNSPVAALFGGLISTRYAADGFGPARGTDTEKYLLNQGDAVLNKKASKIYNKKGINVTAGGENKIRSINGGRIPFRLTPNEKVLPAKEAQKFGYGGITALNDIGNGKTKYAVAGISSSSLTSKSSGGGSGSINISIGDINIGNGGSNDEDLISKIIIKVESELRSAFSKETKRNSLQ